MKQMIVFFFLLFTCLFIYYLTLEFRRSRKKLWPDENRKLRINDSNGFYLFLKNESLKNKQKQSWFQKIKNKTKAEKLHSPKVCWKLEIVWK